MVRALAFALSVFILNIVVQQMPAQFRVMALIAIALIAFRFVVWWNAKYDSKPSAQDSENADDRPSRLGQ